ncbi:transcriptional regulator family: Fungal Specific TF [Paecilomyces variotii]|nr:transcriptional regulator family: Fungal Specific TF [Paecilomyces variotii]
MAGPEGRFAEEQNHNAAPVSANEKKRTRVQFSCTACRQRKLKCDRIYPCSNCTRRGDVGACIYVGRGPKGRGAHPRADLTHTQNRLHHLENLVLSLAQKRRLEGQDVDVMTPCQQLMPETSSQPNGGRNTLTDPALLKASSAEKKNDLVDSPGRLFVEDVGTSYLDAAHWRAILEEINDIKEYIQEEDTVSEDSVAGLDIGEPEGPMLLLGLDSSMSLEDLIEEMPPKPLVDRLVSRSLTSKYPSIFMIHQPTFKREYERFWRNPHAVSVNWLALLYATMALAVAIYHRSNEQLPETLRTNRDALSVYKRHAARCLVLSNYTKPGRYKVEALMVYSAAEMLTDGDPHYSVCFILGITIKLAMRMGYHRDSKHFQNISAYEGEMRRRVWAAICQLDSLTSNQVGLPKTVQRWQFDTELPHNLLDEDFDEDSPTLPPSRSENEYTPALYSICKARLMFVFSDISDLAYSREPASYDKILELDKRLEEAFAAIPPPLRIRTFGESITDSAEVIVRRHTLVFLYNKSRVVLHRKYLTENRCNPRFSYSRSACLDASKEILLRQADIYHEVQPGGQLYETRWFVRSLQVHDFILAAMIICLELMRDDAPRTEIANSDQEINLTLKEKEDLLHVLEMSQDSFKLCIPWSKDARKAYEAVSVMLKRARRGQPSDQKADEAVSINPSSSGLNAAGISSTPLISSGVPLQQDGSYRLESSDVMVESGLTGVIPIDTEIDWAQQLSADSIGVLENMLDTPNNIDWGLWDDQMQGIEREHMNYIHTWGDDPTNGFH